MAVDYSKYKEEKLRRQRREMLTEWYGEAVGEIETVAHGPQLQSIDGLLDKISREVFSPEVCQRIELEQNWEKVAGGQLAALTRPGGFSGGVLDVEVRHAAFLRELDGTQDLLCGRVNGFLGGEYCKSIRFTASSGRRK